MCNKTRGFITIATGEDKYYKMAENLLFSYRALTNQPLPFAILCDKLHPVTDLFDIIILIENATSSYLDKLMMDKYLPFDETFFIDADCLAFSDLNKMFDVFSDSDDFSCLGYSAPFGEFDDGWYTLDSFPSEKGDNSEVITREMAKDRIHYSLKAHGGVYFIRKSTVSDHVFCEARRIIENYEKYSFRKFNQPADEPAFVLAMALNDCVPVYFPKYPLSCYWNTKLIFKRDCCVYREDGTRVPIVHWGSPNTELVIYRQQIDRIKIKAGELKGISAAASMFTDSFALFANKLKRNRLKGVRSKIIESASNVSWMKDVWHKLKKDR